jgi:hypothetical protein
METKTVLTLDAPDASEALHRVYRMLAKWAREAERTADQDQIGSQTQDGDGISGPSQGEDVAGRITDGC